MVRPGAPEIPLLSDLRKRMQTSGGRHISRANALVKARRNYGDDIGWLTLWRISLRMIKGGIYRRRDRTQIIDSYLYPVVHFPSRMFHRNYLFFFFGILAPICARL